MYSFLFVDEDTDLPKFTQPQWDLIWAGWTLPPLSSISPASLMVVAWRDLNVLPTSGPPSGYSVYGNGPDWAAYGEGGQY